MVLEGKLGCLLGHCEVRVVYQDSAKLHWCSLRVKLDVYGDIVKLWCLWGHCERRVFMGTL